MSLNATIARLQLSSFPDAIARRLLQREDVVSLAEMGTAEVGPIGTFHFADIRSTLARIEFDVPTDLPRRSREGPITMVRVMTGLHSARCAGKSEVVLPELGLLDPVADVRLNAFSEIVKRAGHPWPNQENWREVLTGRPLTDSEFGQLIEELQHLVGPTLSRISAVVARGSFGVSDLIPSDPFYYQSLLGGVAIAESSDEYIVKI